MIGIYKITNPKGRVYVGQSIDIHKRWNSYKNLQNNAQRKLYYSLQKYGVESHVFEILTECEINDLYRLERYYQELFNTIEHGLNCILVECDDKPRVVSKETRIRMSVSLKGKKNPIEYFDGLDNEGVSGKEVRNLVRLYPNNTVDMSSALGVPQQRISEYINGKKNITVKRLKQWCDILKIDIKELF